MGESQSSGDVETPIQRVKGKFRALRSDLESSCEHEVPRDRPALVWLVRRASAKMRRFEMGADGLTPYRRLKGKAFTSRICKFGECVWYLKPKSRGKEKADTRWSEGIWLGIRDISGGHIIGTPNRVIKVRTIKRRPASDQWKWTEIQLMRGLPWETIPGRPLSEMRIRLDDDVRPPKLLGPNVGEQRDSWWRNFPVRRGDVLEHGITQGCHGCRAALGGREPGKHKQNCREEV